MNLIIFAEDVIFKHNKYCNVVMVTIINVLLSFLALYLCIDITIITGSIQFSLYIVFLIAVLYQNKEYLTIQSTIKILLLEFIQYWFYTLIYLPCHLFYSFCYHPGNSDNNNSDKNNDSDNNIM